MAATAKVLIVGAGPTGLSAALFLDAMGVPVRLVDKATAPSEHSKALVVNPRTLALLQASGVADRMRAEGRPVGGASLTRDWRPLAEVDFATAGLKSPDPLYVLPQARSEALLTEALAARGIAPERGVELTALEQDAGGVLALLTRAGGREEAVRAGYLFAADGAHSAVRHALGLGFPGSTFPETWPLYDVELKTDLRLDRAYISFFEDGLIFALALDAKVWRVLASFPSPLERLPAGALVGRTVWESGFRISHRLASSLAVGRVALGGDAAHLHSPVGARGMNLGVEDAWVFALRVREAITGDDPQRLAAYGRARHATDGGVVRRIEAITRAARGRPALLAAARDALIPRFAAVKPLALLMARTVTGLDHPLPV